MKRTAALLLFLLPRILAAQSSTALRVDEAATRVQLAKEHSVVSLAVVNPGPRPVSARVRVEALDPQDKVRATAETQATLRPGASSTSLAISLGAPTEKEQAEVLWYRLRYHVAAVGLAPADGIVALAGITPEIFDLRVATPVYVTPGTDFPVRVRAQHPVTGRAVRGVTIAAELEFADREPLRAQGITAADGYASLRFHLPPDVGSERPTLTVSGRHGEFQRQAQDDIQLNNVARFFPTTDKPLYQPGQVVHTRALLLDPAGRPAPGEAVRFTIKDPENTLVYQASLVTSRFGIVQADWLIPENMKLGDYLVLLEPLNSRFLQGTQGTRVRISRYELPNFTVSAKPDRAYYLPGQNATVEVSADYLFGKPVIRGHVRVVREEDRHWNFKEQRWETTEEENYEGETDSKGVFIARLDLAAHHADIKDPDDRRFRDLTYAAYFTDPSTGRTEQRRFQVRVTRDPIHVYPIEPAGRNRLGKFPLDFYVSAFYADGAPCECEVSIREGTGRDEVGPVLRTVRTNPYGVAKVFGLQLPPDPERDPEDSVDLLLRARDSRGAAGQKSEHIYRYSNENIAIRVDSDKTLYRPGEPVAVTFLSSERDLHLVFEVWSDQKLLHSQLVKLHGNKAFVMLPFREEYQGELRLLAYSLARTEASYYSHSVPYDVRTILYPHDTTLKVDVKLSRATYKPGDDAVATLQVGAAAGTPVQAALGAVVFDKAVEERFRTDQEFGQRGGYGFDYAFWDYWGYSDSLGSLTRASLKQLDVSRPFAEDLDLAAEVILNQWGYGAASVFGGSDYPSDIADIFRSRLERQMQPVQQALDRIYRGRMDYPHDEAGLRDLLAGEGIRFADLADPWGMPYHAGFRFSRDQEVMEVASPGPDKQPGSDDDFVVLTVKRPYFQPTGLAINRALQEYHARTGGYVRDAAALKDELQRQGIRFEALRDPWGRPYALDFGVSNTRFYVQVTSGGPDRAFEPQRYGDDFVVWTAYSDYFAEMQAAIDTALQQHFQKTAQFPDTEAGLLAVLREAGISPDRLRDGWGRPLYMTFNDVPHYSDRVVMSYQEYLGRNLPKVNVIAVTQKVSYIHLRSAGEDGKPGTSDDFEIATFSRVVTEQTAQQPAPQPTPHAPPLAQGTGGIEGTITDPVGAVIAGAQVTVTNSDTQVHVNATTDGAGHYEIRDLPAGDYRLQVYAANFKLATVTDVPVRAGQMVELSLSLRVGGATELVTVEASAPLVQTTTSQMTVSKGPGGTAAPIATPRLRQFFPETLLWQPEVVTDLQGRTQLKFKLADNITTWKMSLVASTLDGQIGVVDKEFRAFQPFFVELDPPQVLTQGDEIALPVVLRNYLDKSQTLNVSMQPADWFTLLGPAQQTTSVAAGDSARASFRFRAVAAIREGKQQVTAANRSAGDRVQKPVRVHPDGQELAQSVTQLFDARTTLALDLPSYLMAGTIRAELKLYPNLMDHVLESVEAILERPYGCGEQTISSTYPNVLLLQLYKRLGKPADALSARSLRYTRMGYGRLLGYQDESGGFTYWGHGEPDLALTAYALRFLRDAGEFVSVDPEVVANARQWLIAQQDKDGRWGKSDQLTAYVAWVLASSPAPTGSRSDNSAQELAEKQKVAAEQRAAVGRALDLLASRLDAVPDAYLLSSFALAASLEGRAQDAARARQLLAGFRHEEAGASYWSLETNTPFYGWGRAGRIETTALAVQALTQAGERELARSGLLFLLRNQDRYGVWYSTQATVNVLKALMLLAGGDGEASAGGNAEILVNGRKAASVTLPASGELGNPISVDLSAALAAGINRVEVVLGGSEGPITAQLVAVYYIPWESSQAGAGSKLRTGDSDALRLSVAYDKTDGLAGDPVKCRVHAERLGYRGYGMLLAEIGLPPGAEVDRASLEHAMENAGWAVNRYEVLPDRVVLYLWPRAGGTDFEFSFRPRYGENALTAPSGVYDYYNPEASAVVAPTRFVVRDSGGQTLQARGR